MGQKVHPISYRIGINKFWKSKWYSQRNYRQFLKEDIEIRKFLSIKLKNSGISMIEVERSSGTMTITIHTSKPGMVIGRGGAGTDDLKKKIKQDFLKNRKVELKLTIQEVSKPELDANIVVQNMIEQLEKRMPFRRVLRMTNEQVKRAGGLGVKVMVSGRLNGAEIARTEYLSWGKLPLQTIRANIDYSRGTARTTYGAIGVKVWIYKGEVFENKESEPGKKPFK
ncbi:MAG: 30S ribosomal protein S3 [bacterium]